MKMYEMDEGGRTTNFSGVMYLYLDPTNDWMEIQKISEILIKNAIGNLECLKQISDKNCEVI